MTLNVHQQLWQLSFPGFLLFLSVDRILQFLNSPAGDAVVFPQITDLSQSIGELVHGSGDADAAEAPLQAISFIDGKHKVGMSLVF